MKIKPGQPKVQRKSALGTTRSKENTPLTAQGWKKIILRQLKIESKSPVEGPRLEETTPETAQG